MSKATDNTFVLSRGWHLSRLNLGLHAGKFIVVDKANMTFTIDGQTYDGGRELELALTKKNNNGIPLFVSAGGAEARKIRKEVEKRVTEQRANIIPKMPVVESDEENPVSIGIKFNPVMKGETAQKPLPDFSKKLDLVSESENVVGKSTEYLKTASKQLEEKSKPLTLKLVRESTKDIKPFAVKTRGIKTGKPRK
jgi:hypothetical protein